MILSFKWITKALIRLCGWAGWSATLLFVNHWGQDWFSHIQAQIISRPTITQHAKSQPIYCLQVIVYNISYKICFVRQSSSSLLPTGKWSTCQNSINALPAKFCCLLIYLLIHFGSLRCSLIRVRSVCFQVQKWSKDRISAAENIFIDTLEAWVKVQNFKNPELSKLLS